MNPSNNLLDEMLHFGLSEDQDEIVSSTGCGNRPKHGTLLDLPLNEAIPILQARQLITKFNKPIKERPCQEKVTGQMAPIPKIRLRKTGTSTYSLENVDKGDDGLKIIFERGTVTLKNKQLESFSSPGSSQNIARKPIPEYPKCSPDRAIDYLVDKGMPIEVLIGRLKNLEDRKDQSHKWRCIIIFGDIKVMADSIRKQVAREMAAVQFLEQLAKLNKPCKIPKYTILPEMFIDLRIFHVLEKEARRRGFNVYNYVKTSPVKMTSRKYGGRYVAHLYVSTFFVGKRIYKGQSFVQEYAKLQAAKMAFEGLTRREVPLIKYFTGAFCDPALEYDFGESEIRKEIYMKSEIKKGKEGMTG